MGNEIHNRGAKRMSLTPSYRRELVSAVIKPANLLADRIEGAKARKGSMDDVRAFKTFANRLKVEIAIAVGSGGLADFEFELPEDNHLCMAILRRITPDEDYSPPHIPGIILVTDPTKTGWSGKLVGRNRVMGINSPANKRRLQAL